MSAWADEKCWVPAVSLTVTAGTDGLRLVIGAEGVR
jgi:hypothetical protein